MVKGCVYIDSRSDRQYEKLVVRMEGEESVRWRVYVEDDSWVEENKITSYDSIFTVFDFQGVVKVGQYAFPFTFLLPHSLPGTFTQIVNTITDDINCHIKYYLTATLNHPTSQPNSQQYQLNLNIQ
jgi:ribonucleotide reductase beta subunit family protein with ferritin-like domain